MNNQSKKNKNATLGFSLIEIIIVISMLGILIATAIPNFNQARNRTLLQDAQAAIINALEQAQNRALTGVGDTKHGVHIESDKIITFEGDQYIAGVGNETPLPSSISTDQNNLDIIFDRISARPSTNATININHSSGLSETVEITDNGVISAK